MQQKGNIKVGQLWEIKDSKKKYRCLILKCETIDSEDIIHISILNNNLEIITSHMPFSEGSLFESLDFKLTDTFPLGDFEEGYKIWKDEFNKGEAGVYGVKMASIVG